MEFLKKHFAKLEEYMVMLILSVMSFLVIWQVIARFILKAPLSWTEESARYLMVWLTFLGASIGFKQGAHIGVTAFLQILPRKLRKAGQLLGTFFALLFAAVICVFGFKVVSLLQMTGQLSPAIRMPMWWAYLGVPVGCTFIFIRIAQNAWNTMKASDLNFESTEVKEALELAKETAKEGGQS